MTSMTIPPPEHSPLKKFGFNVYRSGVLIREQVVPAATSAIAEVKIWRYLDTDEYVWYAEPRLLEEEAGVTNSRRAGGCSPPSPPDRQYMSEKPTSVITRLTVLCVSVAVLLWALRIALTLIAAVWWQLLIIACVITTAIVVIITLRNRWH